MSFAWRASHTEMSAITHLIAGVPVSDLDAGIDEHATLFIEPSPASAGAGRIAFAEPPDAAVRR
jgi:hypothetical protein